MGRSLRIEAGAYLLWALWLYLLPLPWVLGAVLAGVVHELGHLIALRIAHVPVYSVSIGGMGAKIETGPMSRIQEIFCSLSGPLCSFLLLFLCKIYPEAALCGLLQGLFNLIPLYPMDGGRAIRCLIGRKRLTNSHW